MTGAPHNLEAEQALLGAILVDNRATQCVDTFLEPDHFFDPLHAQIYERLLDLIRDGKPATAITLRQFFENSEPISSNLTVPQYLGTLAANATSIINAGDYGRTVRDLALRRTAMLAAEDLRRDAAMDMVTPVADLVRQAHAALHEVAADETGWPDPDPSMLQLKQEAAAQMPLKGFGPELEKFIRESAEAACAPTDYVGLSVLVSAAGLIGARRWARAWGTWREPAILWGALVGEPSTNKSPAIDPARSALIAVEAGRMDRFKIKDAEYRDALVQAKAAQRAWEKQVQKAIAKTPTAIPERPKEAREPQQPVRPRVWVANATTDKLARLLSEQPGGVINYSDELSGLIGSFDRYGGEGGDRGFWLELFGGRPYRLDRVGDGSIDIPHNACSLLGTIQPDRLDRCVLSGDNDGLASRFLFAWPDPCSRRKPHANPDASTLRNAFRRIGELDAVLGKDVPLSEDAEAVFQAWWEGPHDADTKAANGMLGEAYNKLSGGALRIALVLELLNWAVGSEARVEPSEISRTSIEAAIAFVDDWAKPMQRRVFAEASVVEADRNAMVLARFLAHERPKTINARQLRLTKKSALPGIRDAKTMEAACGALCEAGWLRPAFTRAGSSKGRQAKQYDVNPRLAQICVTPHCNSSVSSAWVHPAANGPIGANGVTPYTSGKRQVVSVTLQ